MRRLLKLKYNSGSTDKKVFLKYEEQSADGPVNVISFESNEEPHPDLIKALQDMAKHLQEICEIETLSGRLITVRGITVTYKKMDDGRLIRGLVISGTRELYTSQSPMSLNSPHKPEDPYSPTGDEAYCLTPECVEDVERVVREAFAYLDGKRAQGTLDFQTPEPIAISMD